LLATYVLVGVLTFVTQPPGVTAVAAQLTGFAVAGAGFAAAIGFSAFGSRDRALFVALAVAAAGSGFAAGAGHGENNCAIILTGFAASAAATRLSPREAFAIFGIGIAAFEVNVLIYHDGMNELSTFLLQPLGPVGALMVGLLFRARQIQREQSAELLAEQHQVDVLGERARIAREIHDVLAHSLGALGIQIQTARAMLTDNADIDKALEMLLTAQRMAADGLAETRRAVHALRADIKPLDSVLGEVVGAHRERYHVGVAFAVDGAPRPMPADATIAMLRTAQEALVNASKHATGRDVAMRLCYGDTDVRLTVMNELTSANGYSSDGGGYGLTGMRERLRLLNGTLEAGLRDGRWTVSASLPLAAG
jgi:signal transduction histidine kinase